jgi:hypothetical protein
VDIPDSRAAHNPDFGDLTNPKLSSGPWCTITDPTSITRIICGINKAQYHQAHHTPFSSGPLASLIGRRGDTATAKTLLSGLLQHQVLDHLFPETVRILHTLATPAPTLMQATAEITHETVISAYKNLREDSSSSPSSRHVGHYKAACKAPTFTLLLRPATTQKN